MKSVFVFSLISALMMVLAGGCASKKYKTPAEWVAESMVPGNQLPLGSKAEEWSSPKNFALSQGGMIAVQSQYVKHHGSTCHFNVKFTNVGDKFVDALSGLTTQERVNIFHHNSGKVKLEPGKSVAYDDLEARECPIRFGTTTDMDGCAECKAWVVFAQ
ncbi:MAG: hypothetical protein V4598_06275 [Bdellovibrionota bacterium]